MTEQNNPQSTGDYADVNGLHMYYEVHGEGFPLVLLHGGLLSLDISFGELIPILETTHKVIAIEVQGHGRTADIERPVSLEAFSSDVVALLDHLNIDRADFWGFSLGGLITLQTLVQSPKRVRRAIVASAHARPDAYHDDIGDPALNPDSTRMPTADDFAMMQSEYERLAPDPANFGRFMEKLGAMIGSLGGWPTEALGSIETPVLLMFGDNDFVRQQHMHEMYEAIPGAQLSILPGTTHMQVMQRTAWIIPQAESFLLEPSA